jgi:superoxide dismutase
MDLIAEISDEFGSVDEMLSILKFESMKLFGSG